MADPPSVDAKDPLAAELDRFTWQKVIAADQPSRWTLTKLKPTWPLNACKVRVHRNLPFELIEPLLRPFLAFADYEATFEVGPYDESMQFEGGNAGADLQIVAYEYDRFDEANSGRDLAAVVAERIGALRQRSESPILIIDWLNDHERAAEFNSALKGLVESLPGVYVGATSSIAETLGGRLFDDRAADIRGTHFSDAALIGIARSLGLLWMPALMAPRLKMIAVDADETLYAGVVGEDGADGVVLTENHRRFQEALVALHQSGVLLALISRNQPQDIDELFTRRTDFPLQANHFTSLQVGWGNKADGIAAAAGAASIDTSAVLFIDDNPGELASVTSRLPSVRAIHAGAEGESVKTLQWFPGLYTFGVTETDRLRAQDLRANAERQSAMSDADPDEYLRSLGITLVFSSVEADMARAHELSNKTNQFNLTFARMSETAVAAVAAEPNRRGVLVSLKDRLSDSGTVAFIASRVIDDTLEVEEICISCRALGRGIENALVFEALDRCIGVDTVERIVFRYVEGPRNAPALDWLRGVTGDPLENESGAVTMAWPNPDWSKILDNGVITIKDGRRS